MSESGARMDHVYLRLHASSQTKRWGRTGNKRDLDLKQFKYPKCVPLVARVLGVFKQDSIRATLPNLR
jgi:hypothetical protein